MLAPPRSLSSALATDNDDSKDRLKARDSESDDDSDRRPRKLPSFAQGFPSDQKSPPVSDKLPSIHSISRPPLRQTLSDQGPQSLGDNVDRGRHRSTERDDQPPKIKEDPEDDPSPRMVSESPPGSAKSTQTSNAGSGPPRKKRRTSPHQQSQHPPHQPRIRPESVSHHNNDNISNLPLPPAPSFSARRRGMLPSTSPRKAAPSDLVLNPNAHLNPALQPTIQSAPAVPASRLRLHQLQGPQAPLGRMTLNQGGTLPSISIRKGGSNRAAIGAPPIGRVLPSTPGVGTFRSNVLPPTPTPTSSAFGTNTQSHPPVPPTPSSLRHTLTQSRPPVSVTSPNASPLPGSNHKAAFLAPFEAFYDALADARTLKGWLQEQLTIARANGIGNASASGPGGIEDEVERRMRPMREELDWLRSRVGELEETILGMRGVPSGKGLNGGQRDREREPHSASSSPAVSPIPSHRRAAPTSSSRLDPVPSRPRIPSPLGGRRTSNGSVSGGEAD